MSDEGRREREGAQFGRKVGNDENKAAGRPSQQLHDPLQKSTKRGLMIYCSLFLRSHAAVFVILSSLMKRSLGGCAYVKRRGWGNAIWRAGETRRRREREGGRELLRIEQRVVQGQRIWGASNARQIERGRLSPQRNN